MVLRCLADGNPQPKVKFKIRMIFHFFGKYLNSGFIIVLLFVKKN